MKLKYVILPALFFVSVGTANAVDIGVCKLTGCFDGYYKATTTAVTCTICPQKDPATSISGNTGNITSCYIPANLTQSDTTGSYIYTSNCNYSN